MVLKGGEYMKKLLVVCLLIYLGCASNSYNVIYHEETEKFTKKLSFREPYLDKFSVNGAVFHPFSKDDLEGKVTLVLSVFTTKNDFDNIVLHNAVLEYFNKEKKVALQNNEEFTFVLEKGYRANNNTEFYYCGKLLYELDSLSIDKKKPINLSIDVTVTKGDVEKNKKLSYLMKFRKTTFTGFFFD